MPRPRAISILVALASGLAACFADPGDPITPEEAEDASSSELVVDDPIGPARPAPDAGALDATDPPEASMGDVAPPRPTDDGPDAALFDEAMSAREAGDPEAMKEALFRLVRDHPASPLVPNAYIAFGDHLFDEGRMTTARHVYDKASMFPGPTVAYARYKIAWCHLNEGDDADALAAFVAAVGAGHDLGDDDGMAIAHASLRDSVLPYARIGRLDRAPAFYRRLVLDPTDLDHVLAHLAEAALAEGRHDDLEEACTTTDTPAMCTTAEAP